MLRNRTHFEVKNRRDRTSVLYSDSVGREESQLVWAAGFDAIIIGEALTGFVDVAGFNELDGDEEGEATFDVNLELKVNPWRELVLYGNVAIPLDDEGLRTDSTPTVGVE